MTQFTVIVPTNRPAEMIKFITAWHIMFTKHNIQLVVMFDGEEVPVEFTEVLPQFNTSLFSMRGVTILTWKDMTTKLIPQKTDMCRSFAFYWSYKNIQTPYMLTLDDDVRPIEGVDIFTEYENAFNQGTVLSEYFDVGALTTSGVQMRGFPYKDRKKVPVMVQYGGWSGVLDYDAATQISHQPGPEVFGAINITMPKGTACTCCIMNCAWRREATPIMWQLPMLDGRYNRVGDIWSGLFIKKTLDNNNQAMVVNGRATVLHDRASNVYNSLQKEAPSVLLNDNLWDGLNGATDYIDVTNKAYEFFKLSDVEYAENFLAARDEWVSLFQ